MGHRIQTSRRTPAYLDKTQRLKARDPKMPPPPPQTRSPDQYPAFDPVWDTELAMRFADYISYGLRQYDVSIADKFTIFFGPILEPPQQPGSEKKSHKRKTRFFGVKMQQYLSPLAEDIIRLCFVKCVKSLGGTRDVLFSSQLAFGPAMKYAGVRHSALDANALWDAEVWDERVLTRELCEGGRHRIVWVQGVWEGVCLLDGWGDGATYEFRKVAMPGRLVREWMRLKVCAEVWDGGDPFG
ncbi:hypothetical protein F4777DRAFT_559598 [Nemania sp. FL0916]|nr:hypothetical protein F4777DRAFT_559598 [Nemania sp. FL0916]